MNRLHVVNQCQEEVLIAVFQGRSVVPGIPHIPLACLGVDDNEILLIRNFVPVALLCAVQGYAAAAMEIEQQRHLLLTSPQLRRNVFVPGLRIAVIAAKGRILYVTHKPLFRKVCPLLIAAVGIVLPAPGLTEKAIPGN